ncbi:hypothetical protein [Gemmiger formicilis]|uniref:hypothetical protein n=1 Tax=Gemmiger formicilis TaxID=745368 RepID=UPI0039941738
MGISKAVDEAFDVIDIMTRIRQNINMAKADKITQARALERIEELLDRYEMGETLWVEEKLNIDTPAGERS